MFKTALFLLLSAGLMFNAFSHDHDHEYKWDDDRKIPSAVESEVEVPYDQSIGGSGVFEIGLTRLDLDPIKKIVKGDLDKGGFDFDENTFATVGLIGYTGQKRNGMRIGLGAWAGYNSLYSDEWTVRANDSLIRLGSDTLVDSIIQLHLIFAHAGLVVERSFKVLENLNLYAGGMIGGGAMVAIEDRKLANGAFNKVNNNSNWESDTCDYENRVAWAPLWAFDIHGGFTYSLTKWFHLGLDGSTLFYYSSGGFQSKYGNFWTVNPGIKIRFVFGTSV